MVDNNGRLVGVLTIDDVVDVIQEEAEEDLLRLGGVGDEELSDSIASTSRSRVPWLAVNLITAFLSASVISLFDATIQQIVALAILMPAVAAWAVMRVPDHDRFGPRACHQKPRYPQRRPHHQA